MNVSPKQLRAFLAIAEHNSFAEAAEHVHLSQPALSIAIKNLETALGGRLLVRTTRTLALSPEGEEFLPVARRLMGDWDRALRDMHSLFALQRGKLTVAAMPSFAASLLPVALAKFRRNFPNLTITVNDIVAEAVVDAVRSGHAEVGIAFRPERAPDLEFQPLFIDRFMAALPSDHPLVSETSIHWATLARQPLLLLQHPSSIRQLIEDALKNEAIEFVVDGEAHQLVTLGRMVACGLGVSVVPELCADQMARIGAVCRPLIDPIISREVGVLTRRRYPLSHAASALVEIVTTTDWR